GPARTPVPGRRMVRPAGGPSPARGRRNGAVAAAFAPRAGGCLPHAGPRGNGEPEKEKPRSRGARPYAGPGASPLHRGEELVVGLGGLHLVEQERHRRALV